MTTKSLHYTEVVKGGTIVCVNSLLTIGHLLASDVNGNPGRVALTRPGICERRRHRWQLRSRLKANGADLAQARFDSIVTIAHS